MAELGIFVDELCIEIPEFGGFSASDHRHKKSGF